MSVIYLLPIVIKHPWIASMHTLPAINPKWTSHFSSPCFLAAQFNKTTLLVQLKSLKLVYASVGWRFASALLPLLLGKNPRSHHKDATYRVRTGDQLLPVLCHCQLVHKGGWCPWKMMEGILANPRLKFFSLDESKCNAQETALYYEITGMIVTWISVSSPDLISVTSPCLAYAD